MEAVFRFLKNFIGVLLKHIGGDLFAPARGQRMLHHAIRLGQGHAFSVQGIAGEIPVTALGLPLHAHAHPHIGEKHVGIPGGFVGVMHQPEGIAVGFGLHQHIGRRVVAPGAGHRDLHAHGQAPHDQAVGHVVAVADKAHAQPFQFPLVLPHRHQVGEDLQRVGVVGHAGHHRHAAVLGQGVQVGLLVGTADNGIIIPAQYPGGILDGLAPGGLQIVGA